MTLYEKLKEISLEFAHKKALYIIEFRKELPTTPTGRILKRVLREEINR